MYNQINISIMDQDLIQKTHTEKNTKLVKSGFLTWLMSLFD